MRYMLAICLFILTNNTYANTQSSSLNWISPIDNRQITGLLLQKEALPKDAPVAILLHAMNTHTYHWLATGAPTYGGQITDFLLDKGYRIIALDARAHGHRKYEDSAEARMDKANNGEPESYLEMIEGTVKDYEFALTKIEKNFADAKHIVAIGYSMGAQMAIMLAAKNPQIDHLITMVPPHAGNVSIVSPVTFAPKVKAKWLLLLANKDEYSTARENNEIADAISAPHQRIDFDSGHVLPETYVFTVKQWLDAIK